MAGRVGSAGSAMHIPHNASSSCDGKALPGTVLCLSVGDPDYQDRRRRHLQAEALMTGSRLSGRLLAHRASIWRFRSANWRWCAKVRRESSECPAGHSFHTPSTCCFDDNRLVDWWLEVKGVGETELTRGSASGWRLVPPDLLHLDDSRPTMPLSGGRGRRIAGCAGPRSHGAGRGNHARPGGRRAPGARRQARRTHWLVRPLLLREQGAVSVGRGALLPHCMLGRLRQLGRS